MPLYRRVARRGFSNYWFKKEYTVINLSSLEKKFSNGERVTLESLREKGLVGINEVLVKILGEGEITKKLVLAGVKVSRSAQAKIEAAGGSVEGASVAQPEPVVEETSSADSSSPDSSNNDGEEE